MVFPLRRLALVAAILPAAAAAFAAGPTACPASAMSVDDVIAKVIAPSPNPVPADAAFYYACQALIAQKRDPCDHLKALLGSADKPLPWSPSRICLDTWRDITRVQIDADALKPGIKKRCVDFLVVNPDDEFMLFKDNDAACDVILANRGKWQTRSALLAPMASVFLSTTQVAESIKDEKELIGNSDAKECAKLSENRRPRCLSAFYFQKAYAAHDAKLCAGQPLCRALMGGGLSSCAPYAAGLKAAACAFDAPRSGKP